MEIHFIYEPNLAHFTKPFANLGSWPSLHTADSELKLNKWCKTFLSVACCVCYLILNCITDLIWKVISDSQVLYSYLIQSHTYVWTDSWLHRTFAKWTWVKLDEWHVTWGNLHLRLHECLRACVSEPDDKWQYAVIAVKHSYMSLCSRTHTFSCARWVTCYWRELTPQTAWVSKSMRERTWW